MQSFFLKGLTYLVSFVCSAIMSLAVLCAVSLLTVLIYLEPDWSGAVRNMAPLITSTVPDPKKAVIVIIFLLVVGLVAKLVCWLVLTFSSKFPGQSFMAALPMGAIRAYRWLGAGLLVGFIVVSAYIGSYFSDLLFVLRLGKAAAYCGEAKFDRAEIVFDHCVEVSSNTFNATCVRIIEAQILSDQGLQKEANRICAKALTELSPDKDFDEIGLIHMMWAQYHANSKDWNRSEEELKLAISSWEVRRGEASTLREVRIFGTAMIRLPFTDSARSSAQILLLGTYIKEHKWSEAKQLGHELLENRQKLSLGTDQVGQVKVYLDQVAAAEPKDRQASAAGNNKVSKSKAH